MINEIIEKIQLHMSRAKKALLEIENWDNLGCEIFEDFEKIMEYKKQKCLI